MRRSIQGLHCQLLYQTVRAQNQCQSVSRLVKTLGVRIWNDIEGEESSGLRRAKSSGLGHKRSVPSGAQQSTDHRTIVATVNPIKRISDSDGVIKAICPDGGGFSVRKVEWRKGRLQRRLPGSLDESRRYDEDTTDDHVKKSFWLRGTVLLCTCKLLLLFVLLARTTNT